MRFITLSKTNRILIDINLLSFNNNLIKLKINKININYFHHSINKRNLNVKLNLLYHFFKINIFLYIDLNNYLLKFIKNRFIRIIIIINYNYFNKYSRLLIARHRNLQIKNTIRKIISIKIIIR